MSMLSKNNNKCFFKVLFQQSKWGGGGGGGDMAHYMDITIFKSSELFFLCVLC